MMEGAGLGQAQRKAHQWVNSYRIENWLNIQPTGREYYRGTAAYEKMDRCKSGNEKGVVLGGEEDAGKREEEYNPGVNSRRGVIVTM